MACAGCFCPQIALIVIVGWKNMRYPLDYSDPELLSWVIFSGLFVISLTVFTPS